MVQECSVAWHSLEQYQPLVNLIHFFNVLALAPASASAPAPELLSAPRKPPG